MTLLGGQGGYSQKLSYDSETSDMTSDGLGEMFECDSADTCAGKFPLRSMGARAEGPACADPGARTPIGVSGNFFLLSHPMLPPLFNGKKIKFGPPPLAPWGQFLVFFFIYFWKIL